MTAKTRLRQNLVADAEQATVHQILSLRDSCELFDAGRDHQFLTMSVSLRTLCHHGSSGCLLNNIREKARHFPSSVSRDFSQTANATCDHFTVAQVSGGNRILPRLELTVGSMKTKKFTKWWQEVIAVDGQRRSMSRGNIVLAVANNDGGAHFTSDVNEIYDDIARFNGLGLHTFNDGAWRNFGIAPVQAIIRQVAHEFLLGMTDWISSRRQDWSYTPSNPEITGFAISPGIIINAIPAQVNLARAKD